MYEYPIKVTYGQANTTIADEIDDHILYRVNLEIGVDINKEELIKALQYDRDQYTKGYEDGKREGMSTWISYSQQIPEKSDNYLILTKDGQVDMDYFQFGCMWDDYGDDVVAWLPLPKSWGGETK